MMMNDTPNSNQLTLIDSSAIDLTFTNGPAHLHIMRLDAEEPDDTCEGDEACNEPILYQITIADAPELTDSPDIYLLCHRHAAPIAGAFLLNAFAG